jgi:parallel beta-helix repeat protein
MWILRRTSKPLRRILLLMLVLLLWAARGRLAWLKEGSMTVSVGPAEADVVGTDNVALQKAVDRVAAAGGGIVLIKAGTYTLNNSLRLASHITLRGEGPEKTILKKAAGIKSKLALDADYGEFFATVEDARDFAPGMGVTILDKVSPGGWTPSVRTIVRVEGQKLYFDKFLHMDYSVANGGVVFNTFPVIAGYEVEDVRVEELTVDGNRASSEALDGCQAGAIYFFHSQRMTIKNCVARDYPGDGISTQFVEDPVVENCEVYRNAELGIHLGTGAQRGVVRFNRAHDNGADGLYLCWRVQHARYEQNQSWNNGQDGISLGHKDTDNVFFKNVVSGNGRAGIFFRDELENNAASRNTFSENTVEANGRPGGTGYGIRIEGATRDLKFFSNTLRGMRKGDQSIQTVGLYLGPKTDGIVFARNVFEHNLNKAVVDESQGTHNALQDTGD